MKIIFGWIDGKGEHQWLGYNSLDELLEDELDNYLLSFSLLNNTCFNFDFLNDLVNYLGGCND